MDYRGYKVKETTAIGTWNWSHIKDYVRFNWNITFIG